MFNGSDRNLSADWLTWRDFNINIFDLIRLSAKSFRSKLSVGEFD